MLSAERVLLVSMISSKLTTSWTPPRLINPFNRTLQPKFCQLAVFNFGEARLMRSDHPLSFLFRFPLRR